jgi:tripartite motif-containing protein 71
MAFLGKVALAACMVAAGLHCSGSLCGQDVPRPKFLLTWGEPGEGPGQFHSPIGLALGAQDEVFVTDLNNGRLQRFTSNGKHLGMFDLPFDTPPKRQSLAGGIAIDDEGLLYVSFMQQDKVRVYSPDGMLVREWGEKGPADGQLWAPGGIVMGPEKTLYVADQRNHRVQQFTLGGKFVAKWGGHGAEAGQFGGMEPAGSRFAGPHFLARDRDGAIYTTEGTNCRVQRFTAAGLPLAAWGQSNNEPGGFGMRDPEVPTIAFGLIGVTVDRQGRVWTSSLNDRVQCFAPDGRFLLDLKFAGDKPGPFAQPHSLAIDRHGFLYVADAGNQRIVKVELEGEKPSPQGQE